MLRLVAAAALLLVGGHAGAAKPRRPPAPAAAARPDRAAVEARLRAHEIAPSAADWKALGPDVDRVLIEIGGDGRAEAALRARAVSALGHLPTQGARRFLDGLIADRAATTDAAERLLVRRAAVALGWMGGPAVPQRLGPLLESPDAEVRLDAAIGLGLTRLASAADLLRKRFAVEPVARVRTQIGRQLRVIEEALAASPPRGGGRDAAAPLPPPAMEKPRP